MLQFSGFPHYPKHFFPSNLPSSSLGPWNIAGVMLKFVPVLQRSPNPGGLPWLPWVGWNGVGFPQNCLDAYIVLLMWLNSTSRVLGPSCGVPLGSTIEVIEVETDFGRSWGYGFLSRSQEVPGSIGRLRSRYQGAHRWMWHLGTPPKAGMWVRASESRAASLREQVEVKEVWGQG